MSSHKCFISFKTEDIGYKERIQNDLDVEMIDKSLNEPLNADSEDGVMRQIREKYLMDSTVTIFLIGSHSSENDIDNQHYIQRELQASLYKNRNGILGVVLPEMYDKIYKGSSKCPICGETHNIVDIDDSTVIKEFSENYYIQNGHTDCAWSEDERYCVLVKWDDFRKDPNHYIDEAYDKRNSDIEEKITVYPNRGDGKINV